MGGIGPSKIGCLIMAGGLDLKKANSCKIA